MSLIILWRSRRNTDACGTERDTEPEERLAKTTDSDVGADGREKLRTAPAELREKCSKRYLPFAGWGRAEKGVVSNERHTRSKKILAQRIIPVAQHKPPSLCWTSKNLSVPVWKP
mmetsp:Transcript_4197/g.12616  ORF Transcript_4197/g.12616 Transcript_4197/m.12616 type:complete len:115 (+) Transcript_4197:1190-1534(+)